MSPIYIYSRTSLDRYASAGTSHSGRSPATILDLTRCAISSGVDAGDVVEAITVKKSSTVTLVTLSKRTVDVRLIGADPKTDAAPLDDGLVTLI